MKEFKRSENQQKILDSLDLIYERLIAYKKKMNSDLVIMKDGKIIHVKPEDLDSYK